MQGQMSKTGTPVFAGNFTKDSSAPISLRCEGAMLLLGKGDYNLLGGRPGLTRKVKVSPRRGAIAYGPTAVSALPAGRS
jgi:hypothetical protein